MATSSSGNLGTQQENTKESDLTSAKAKPATPSKAELAAEELVAERLPDEVDSTVETNTDAVGEAVAQVIEATTFEEILTDGRVRIDAIDDQILELLVRRLEVAGTLLSAKHVRRIDPRDKRRQAEIFNRLNRNVADLTTDNGVNLNEHQIRELYELFIRFGIESFRKNIIDGRHRR
jgi:chorismate mutase